MIQRIQSVYLLLGAGALFLLLHSSLRLGGLDDQGESVLEAAVSTSFADGRFTVDDHLLLLILTLVSGCIALGGIFAYKNRPFQIQLVKVFIVGALFVNGMAGYLIWKELGIVQENISVGFDIGPGLALPLLAIVMGYLAITRIRKDEQIVRSMNRLR
jgi:hypothetical protein